MSRLPDAREAPEGPAPAPREVAWSPVALSAMVGCVAAAGVPLGLLWWWAAPTVPVRVTAGGVSFAEQQPQQVAAADGWFALLGLAFGVLAAAGVWMLAPRLRGAAGLLGLSVGLVAAGLLAWWVGRQIGVAGYEAALAAAEPGTTLARPADLRVVSAGWWPPLVTGVPLIPALAAAVTYTLLAAWSRYPTLWPEATSPPASGGPEPL